MYKQLTHYERERIGILQAKGLSGTDIGKRLKRDPSTIRRELKRLGPHTRYSPLLAQLDARKKQKIPRTPKKLRQAELWKIVEAKLRLKWSPEQIARYLEGTYVFQRHARIS